MDDMTAFERQVAGELVRRAGPVRPVDAAAMLTAITATQSPRWGFRSMFSATKFVVAGAIVALFGGFLLAAVLTQQPSGEQLPAVGASASAAVGTGEPASSPEPGPSISPKATDEVYEATARLVVDPGPDPSVQDLALAEAALVRYAGLARSHPVAQAVIDELGLDEGPESLLGRVSTEASADTLVLSIAARDGDPAVARELALRFGGDLRQRVRDQLITDEVKAADAAIAANESLIETLEKRLSMLVRKTRKTQADRSEIIALAAQIAALRRDNQDLREDSRSHVRNLLVWAERPTVPRQPVRDEGPEAALPAIVGTVLDQLKALPVASSRSEVVVASQPIPRGTVLEPEMLTLRAVAPDASIDKALTDTADAIGRVAAIDIFADQVISPDMFLVAE